MTLVWNLGEVVSASLTALDLCVDLQVIAYPLTRDPSGVLLCQVYQ